MRSRVSVYAGLAHGIAESGVHSCGHGFYDGIMGSYGKDYQGAVETTQAMNETIVEYIGGIEVIKAFNQGKKLL